VGHGVQQSCSWSSARSCWLERTAANPARAAGQASSEGHCAASLSVWLGSAWLLRPCRSGYDGALAILYDSAVERRRADWSRQPAPRRPPPCSFFRMSQIPSTLNRLTPVPLPENIASVQPGGGFCYRVELLWGRWRRWYL